MGRFRGNRPPRELTAEREAKAWALRQKGYTQEQVAEMVGIAQGSIGRMLDKLNDRALAANVENVSRIKIEQTRMLWWSVGECLRAWEASKEPLHRVRQNAAGETVTDVVRREGNVQYMLTAYKGLAEIRSIWGLDVAPALQETSTTVADIIMRIEQADAEDGSQGTYRYSPSPTAPVRSKAEEVQGVPPEVQPGDPG